MCTHTGDTHSLHRFAVLPFFLLLLLLLLLFFFFFADTKMEAERAVMVNNSIPT
jgi:hypothetical protein